LKQLANKQFDHMGIAVRQMEESVSFYTNMLGGKIVDEYTSEAPGVETHITIIDIDGSRVELLKPTSKTSPIHRFIQQKGKGVHHIAYRVPELDKAISELKREGIRFLEDTRRTNKHGRRLIYVNPVDTEGTIIELCDYPDEQ